MEKIGDLERQEIQYMYNGFPEGESRMSRDAKMVTKESEGLPEYQAQRMELEFQGRSKYMSRLKNNLSPRK